MPTHALLLTLLAALLHATWNLLVKSGGDRLMAGMAITAGAGLVNIPVLLFAGLPSAEAVPYLLVSALVHTAYIVSLAVAYERADFALAYPIARGVAPLLVTVGGVLLAGDQMSLLGMVGVILVALSILSLVQMRRRGQRIDAAILTGFLIASYTVIDGKAVRATEDSLRYLAALFLLHGVVLLVIVVGVKRRKLADFAGLGPTAIGGGGAAALAYLLVLIASRDAPLGLVSGIRELSVVFGVVAGVTLLGERVGRRHIAAVLGAALGALLIAAS